VTALRAARIAAGLSLRQAAKHASLSETYLAALERRGGAGLSWRRAAILASIYRTSITDLITRREGRGTASERQ